MVRLFLGIGVFLFVAACGGPAREPSASRIVVNDTVGFATGPIGTACLNHRKRDATQARCGCIQQVANQTLTQAQQQRSVRYFSEPSLLQEVRQSSAPANQRFWEAWKNFSETAETQCANT